MSENYELVWSDEFDREGPPDPAHWVAEQGFRRNHELQWYESANAFCRDGRLVLEGRRESRENPDHQPGSQDWRLARTHAEYTSACLTTEGRHAWRFGRFEVRARIPVAPGLWPAIWFLGVGGRWPSRGEIDLMEYYEGQILANLAWGSARPSVATWRESRHPLARFGPAWADQFHVWRMDWEAARIQLRVDDVLLNSVDLAEAVNPTDEGPRHPFHQPHFLLLNLAIGGKCGGDPSATEFPVRYDIDYVRVYQKPSAAPPA